MPPTTRATEALDAAGVDYTIVEYGRVSSAEEAAEARGIRLEQLVKTLVVRVEEGEYPAEAKEATGYERGTITPFGAEGNWPVILDRRLEGMDLISLGAGVHGAALNLTPADVISFTNASVLDVAK